MKHLKYYSGPVKHLISLLFILLLFIGYTNKHPVLIYIGLMLFFIFISLNTIELLTIIKQRNQTKKRIAGVIRNLDIEHFNHKGLQKTIFCRPLNY